MSDLTKEQIEEIRADGLLAGTFDTLCDMALAKKEAEERAAEAEREAIKLETKYKQQVQETYRQWVSSMEWKRNAENISSVFCSAHRYMVESDGEDGDVRNKHRQCPFCEAAELHAEKRKLEGNTKSHSEEYQPISTAPTGVRLLLKSGIVNPPVVGIVERYEEEEGIMDSSYPVARVVHYNGTNLVVGFRPTHWRYIDAAENQDPWIPNINVRYVISDGLVKGDTFLNVLEIQREDDGSLTVVASQ